ncbi:MAG: imidazolonepropionase [bacterium]|nr:imidazolonepropionase [bacterium]
MSNLLRVDSDLLKKHRPSLLVRNIGQLCSLDTGNEAGPRRRTEMSELGMIENAALLICEDKIAAVGPEPELLKDVLQCESLGNLPVELEVVDADGFAVIPGFVDPHTHSVFGKTRQDEYERRIKGETYLEIAAAGGGIHSSVSDLRQRSEEELVDLTTGRLQEMLSYGTTTVEIKSGYGLTLEDELKMLRAAGRAAENVGIRLVRTCLAAHEIPKEYKDNRRAYVDLVTDEILVRVKAENLAERCDVFCEPTVFDLEESLIILSRARDLGMELTVHADELATFGGAQLAARLGAQSADHLIKIDSQGRQALAQSDTVAVMLPGTVFSLGIKNYPPGREMIDQGCILALASDYNPGSCNVMSMPLIMALACTQMRLLPAETLVASTLNAAWALGRGHEVGSLAPGKKADFLILDDSDYRIIPYRAGHNPVKTVFLGGQRVLNN